MDIRSAFPSKYLRAADILALPNKTIRLTIAGLKLETLQSRNKEDEQKPVLYFRGAKKGLVLNKTNSDRIAHHYGWNTDEWSGKTVDLYVAEVDAFGEVVEAIRVKVATGPTTAAAPSNGSGIHRQTEPIQEPPPADPFEASDSYEPAEMVDEPPF